MTVLSFDGIFISYLKAATDFSDPFVAGMRALCVLMGLLGTFAMPFLDKWVGLTRAASWSIWCVRILAFSARLPWKGTHQ